MSAETLRRAAALMRERGEAATPGLWRCDPERQRSSRPADCYDVIDDSTLPIVGSVPHADAAHIASWDPTVALAVADWLENEALAVENIQRNRTTYGPALAVARAYLGEPA